MFLALFIGSFTVLNIALHYVKLLLEKKKKGLEIDIEKTKTLQEEFGAGEPGVMLNQ